MLAQWTVLFRCNWAKISCALDVRVSYTVNTGSWFLPMGKSMGSRRRSYVAAVARKSKGDAKDGQSGKEKQFYNYYHSTYSIRQYLTDQYVRGTASTLCMRSLSLSSCP